MSEMGHNVMIHSTIDESIDRAPYDAELYDGQNDGVQQIHLTDDRTPPSNISTLSSPEIHKIIDDITTRNTTI